MTIQAEEQLEYRTVLGFRVLKLRDPKVRRVAQLLFGPVIMGLALALSLKSNLGVAPWTVFHEGLALQTGISIGSTITIVSFLILLLFRPLKEPLGPATLWNAASVGLTADLFLFFFGEPESMTIRVIFAIVAPLIIGLGSGIYLGAGLGPGPRDGLMTALNRKGLKISTARTVLEVAALAFGWLMGGTAGFGTVWFAVSIGWLVRLSLSRFSVDNR